jgi:HAD-superfamily subfamily IB hydrolase, TIGR01490
VQLAIFDLDNTLLGGDSDYLWSQYLIEHGVVARAEHEAQSARFMREYEAGTLDIDEFLAFALQPLAAHPYDTLCRWRQDFIARHIEPCVLPAAQALVDDHRQRGDTLMIITATNRFVTEPIAERFGIPYLLATEPEVIGGAFSGRHSGTPTFQAGKITALQAWLDAAEQHAESLTFYSDSHNDLPLLRHVDNPVAIDPDPRLAAAAQAEGWPILTLRQGDQPQPLTQD